MHTSTQRYLFIFCLTMFFCQSLRAEIINLEKSVESNQLTIFNASGNGIIVARECATCPDVRLNITPNTQAFHDNKPVPLSSVPSYNKSAITVVYDPATLAAKRIYW
ncbi:MAG: hypothetical protein HY080_11200 [Gammaproteobacteria bacterium]|nr:hypothetical protein [Gammaproteobacteria bacterium]